MHLSFCWKGFAENNPSFPKLPGYWFEVLSPLFFYHIFNLIYCLHFDLFQFYSYFPISSMKLPLSHFCDAPQSWFQQWTHFRFHSHVELLSFAFFYCFLPFPKYGTSFTLFEFNFAGSGWVKNPVLKKIKIELINNWPMIINNYWL